MNPKDSTAAPEYQSETAISDRPDKGDRDRNTVGGAIQRVNRPQYLLIYAEDKVEEASAQIRNKIIRGEAWDLPGYSPDPNLDDDDYEGQAAQHVRRVRPAWVLGNDVARTINGLLLVQCER